MADSSKLFIDDKTKGGGCCQDFCNKFLNKEKGIIMVTISGVVTESNVHTTGINGTFAINYALADPIDCDQDEIFRFPTLGTYLGRLYSNPLQIGTAQLDSGDVLPFSIDQVHCFTNGETSYFRVGVNTEPNAGFLYIEWTSNSAPTDNIRICPVGAPGAGYISPGIATVTVVQ